MMNVDQLGFCDSQNFEGSADLFASGVQPGGYGICAHDPRVVFTITEIAKVPYCLWRRGMLYGVTGNL